MKNFVIGYGSLINSESRNVTGKGKVALPIWLQHHERTWSASFTDIQFCALAIHPKLGQKINAVVFECEDIAQFDRREYGYNRIEISNDLIEMYNSHQEKPDGKFWLYMVKPENLRPPSAESLIWQSYVDVCLMGCFEYNEKYAHDFLNSTTGWSTDFWSNDRENSDYLKALSLHSPEKIDALLRQFNLFAKHPKVDNAALKEYVKNKLNPDS